MKKCVFIMMISVMAVGVNGHASESDSKSNLNFENTGPYGWSVFQSSPGYSIALDRTNVKSGACSIAIEHTGGEKSAGSQTVEFELPNYDGRKITLSGYIKTENVTDGFAGLWMRIDPGIASDHMSRRGITGTTDWIKCEITLSLEPAKTTSIVIGGLLVGKGKMWLDDLTVAVDGKIVTKDDVVERRAYPAKEDKEFDAGSTIDFPPLDEQLVANLDLLGKLWGFLKYHHPEVGKGNYNWDYELFRLLPSYLKVTGHEERDRVLLDWINKYGAIPVRTTTRATSPDAFIKPDLAWTEKSGISDDLKKKIHEIHLNRHQGRHFYIKMATGVAKPEFFNENAYDQMPYPDPGFRLLALYRYWNIIQYFFPYRYMTDKNWDDVLKEYIPLFIAANDKLEYEQAVLRTAGEICDSHVFLWKGWDKIENLKGNNNAPFPVRFIEGKLVVMDHSWPQLKEAPGLEIGDIITHVNGETVESLVEQRKKYYPASNEAARLRNIARDILRSRNDTIEIRYISSEGEKQKELWLYPKGRLAELSMQNADKHKKCYKFLEDDIGYVNLANIKYEEVQEIKNAFEKAKAIIIDIRNYPSAFVHDSLGPYFVSKHVPFAKFSYGNVDNPGEFIFKSDSVVLRGDKTYRGKLVVLVNEFTQSSAEYLAMVFRAGDNTTIVGSNTAGADGDLSFLSLPGGLVTTFSGLGVYYPDGTKTQRIGIVPDIKVEPTIEGIRQGKDEVLEKAIEIINNEAVTKKQAFSSFTPSVHRSNASKA